MNPNDLDHLCRDLVFFRNAFNSQSLFSPIVTKKEVNHPLNMKYNDSGFVIEIAAIGVDRKDVDITAQDDILSVCYNKPETSEDYVDVDSDPGSRILRDSNGYTYKYRGISQKSFRFDWKVGSQLNIQDTRADLKDGLLVLTIPIKPESKARKISL